ncbi:phosphatidylinositol 3 and 4-kinase-domain-containing protein [Annulohypoxylon maeteangense]|uniref:phosphatidylinositol 3 and 4-kinase-domain-containing protein n=1 Tax=Annulohypoxylon maeteangense TaxID=1927788 RepID=UPI002008B3D8|nr:phosphatidylinositol 3 and 4-kinase-domain-containing protein [Annulohypoxylon maeteangense]KAI0888829.1 phosphatidylinositol 3 and 4-kinase-domain-containing protein [Annulohypoxylon maeteangense]
MPRSRPATTGYERLAQADQFSDESDDDILAQSSASLQPQSAPRFAPINQPRPHSGMTSPKAVPKPKYRPKRMRSNSGVDLKAINARLERWADEIASKFKRGKGKGSPGEEERLEIHYSVFQPPEGVRPATAETLATMPEPDMSKHEFEAIVESVRDAIDQGMHPSMITQGSSGSYFARNTDGKIVGVFKPKDEEPYAAGNPKWNKWIHRNLFPCCFGRACLIPNLSYVSEAAAYVLDCQLRTHIVPYTDVVYLSSKSFHYPYWDRRSFYRKKKPLPSKPGSFQVFLKGFKDANVFLREHPWPDQYWSSFRTNDTHRHKQRKWADNCRPSSRRARSDDSESEDENGMPEQRPLGPNNFMWTESLKQAFREQLEKLVILDYIMRNTDRGLDNWMVKVDWETQAVSIASEPPQLNMDIPEEDEEAPRPVELPTRSISRSPNPYKTQKPMNAAGTRKVPDPKISIGAIDNSLSWPWKHPDAWRSFPFGWLFLPVDLIGRPFSQKTRDHFLPLLTSTQWWSQTSLELRKVFQLDPDFQEKMFSRQMAVMKGQAWNVVETLKTPDHGPLELTRRARVCVWDDLVEVPVAVPMRATSSDIRRRAEAARGTIQEEMDIGAANSSSAPANVDDLLGFSSPLPNPGRFELASPHDQSPDRTEALTPNGTPQTLFDALAINEAPAANRPKLTRNPRSSYQGPARAQMNNMYSPRRERRYSATTTNTPRNGNVAAKLLYGNGYLGDEDDEDIEGDLGYAAAETMDGNRRKVIVERLETVKARNPVFTWC